MNIADYFVIVSISWWTVVELCQFQDSLMNTVLQYFSEWKILKINLFHFDNASLATIKL